MQRFHEQLSTTDLDTFLERGALAVWLHRHTNGFLSAVLDYPDHSDQTETILAFLQSVNPVALDEAMAKGARLSQSAGESALQALMSLAGGGDERS